MPDKLNENKFMAMLERKGIVRKADEDIEAHPKNPEAVRPRSEAELRSRLGQPDVMPDVPPANVTPASRQPVPGMMSPIVPSDNRSIAGKPEDSKTGVVIPIEKKPAMFGDMDEPKPKEQEQTMPITTMDAEIDNSYITQRAEPKIAFTPAYPIDEEIKKDDRISEASASDSEYDFRASISDAEERAAAEPPAPPRESDTSKYMDIDELYEVLSLDTGKTDTIYLVEKYLKTLPDSLPEDSRRDIVSKIVSASGFDYDQLMGDGVLRVKMLKEYAEKFARQTEQYVSERQNELEELDKQAIEIRKHIETRRELHKRQFFTIETEAQRLKEILTFISG